MRLFKVVLLLSTALLLADGASKVVARISPDSVTDLSGRSNDTAKRRGIEKGADDVMGTVIHTITDEEKGGTVTYDPVDLNLIRLEDNSKVWLGQKKIKKLIGRRKVNL